MRKYTELEIAEIIGNANTEKAIEKALANIPHERNTECDYYNIYIPKYGDGCIRVYLEKRGSHRYSRIQKLVSVTMKYSGTPVFFATGMK